jgi:hypothetical protein
MFTQLRVTRSIPLLFTLCALVACDSDEFEPRDAEEAVVEEEEDAVTPAELAAADQLAQAEVSEDAEAPGDVETDVPRDARSSQCANNCRAENYAFCFWTNANCTGTRWAFSGGTDFGNLAFSPFIVRSYHKREGTVPVALRNGGSCVQAPWGKASGNVPNGISFAEWNGKCP